MALPLHTVKADPRVLFLRLTRDLLLFDLETTKDPEGKDRIVQVGCIRYSPNRIEAQKLSILVNPECPITPESTEVHNITDGMVKDKPTLEEWAKHGLRIYMSNVDYSGFNVIRYDYDVLVSEFSRIGRPLDIPEDLKFYDAMKVYHAHQPRNLAAAYEHYTGKKMVDAHDALADCNATAEVMFDQISQDKESQKDSVTLEAYSAEAKGGCLDWEGKFKRLEDGRIVFTFGNHKDEEARSEPSYLRWMITADFSSETKFIAAAILGGRIT